MRLLVLLLALALVPPAAAQFGLTAHTRASGNASTLPRAPAATPFVLGFNQGWLRTHYSSQWTSRWDEAEADRMLEATRRFGGGVLRMWLFCGIEAEGILWDGGEDRTWNPPRRRHRPSGVAPEKLAHLGRFLELAAARGVRVYLTLLSGNMHLQEDKPNFRHRHEEWWNILNDRYGAGRGFRERVLAPVLEVVARHREAVFAIDLMNEGNALARAHWFSGGWPGMTRFVRRWRAFIRARVDVPVGVSYGHHTATADFLAGRVPADAVDFHDIHLYNDRGSIPRERAVAARIRALGQPVYLGEFGQKREGVDDGFQASVTRAFVENARRVGFAGALAWRLSDVRPGDRPQERHSFDREDGSWRPAAWVMRELGSPPES